MSRDNWLTAVVVGIAGLLWGMIVGGVLRMAL